MTSSEFTEHFSGSNKVHYPISNIIGFTVVITPVDRLNYINVECPHRKILLLIGINLQESADWFKLTNEILNIQGNIILCEVPAL